MKQLIAILCFIGLAGNLQASMQSDEEHTKTVQVGQYTVERLAGLAKYPEQLLSALIYPGQQRTINVYMGINAINLRFMRLNHYQQRTPYFRLLEQLIQGWLPEAWESWRQAANIYLKPKYRLPKVTWNFISGFDAAQQHRLEDVRSTALIRVETEFMSTDNELAAAYSVFNEQGKGLSQMTVYLFPQWEEILSTLQAGKEFSAQQKAAYKKLILNHTAYTEDQKKKYSAQLDTSDPATWHQNGPWAKYLQSTISHEFGHILGLPHAPEPSLMTPYANTGTLRPTPEDGLRLATLVCWYHNKKAQKTVCIPQTPKDKLVQELRATLAK